MSSVWLKLALIIIIVGAVAFYFLTGSSSARVLNANTTLSLQNGQAAYFKFPGSSDTYSIMVQNSTTSGAVVYISKVPVLTTPIVAFASSTGAAVNVSTGGGRNANLQVKITASGTNAASLMLTPIPTSFSIRVSLSVRLLSPASFTTNNNSTATLIVSTSTTTTSTTTASTTTTAPATTTVNNTNPAIQSAIVMANSTYIGIIVNKYKALYVKDTACTPSTYNSTFLTYRSQVAGLGSAQPVGVFSFANVSSVTPTTMTANGIQLTSSTYTINYLSVTPSRTYSGVAVTLNLNTTSDLITLVSFKGIYQGQNYTTLNNNYNFQNGISGNCGAYIP